MRLRSKEFCPIHKSASLWARGPSQTEADQTGGSAGGGSPPPAWVPRTAISGRDAEAVESENR